MVNDNFFYDKISDMFLTVDRKISLKYTYFLDSSEIAKANDIIVKLKKMYPQVEYIFWGGFNGAERKILCVYNSYLECNLEDFPISVIEFNYSKNFSKLTHRDFLGSIMALQVKRDAVGDIIIGEDKTQVVVSTSIAKLILNEINCIGKLGVKTSIVNGVSLEVKQNFKDITGTVPSLRLDCVLSLALNISRSRALQIVKSKVVAINYLEQTSPDFLLKQDDIITVKGFGKFVLCTISEPTKKNRLHILIKKYL